MSTIDYTITDPTDALYDPDEDDPEVNAQFEWWMRLLPEERAELHRRHRHERQELAARHSEELRLAVREGAP